MDLFLKHSWKGNVRELQNVIGRSVATVDGESINLADLPFNFITKTIVASVRSGNYYKTLDQVSRELCKHALDAARGNRRKAANLMGISRAQLYRMLSMYRLRGEDKN
jgi:DNA-binding NtrC family response regulator